MTIRKIFENHHADFPYPWEYCDQLSAEEVEEMACVLEFLNGERQKIDDGIRDFWMESCPRADILGMMAHILLKEADGTSGDTDAIEPAYAYLRNALHKDIFSYDKLVDCEWANFRNASLMMMIRDCKTAADLNARRAA